MKMPDVSAAPQPTPISRLPLVLLMACMLVPPACAKKEDAATPPVAPDSPASGRPETKNIQALDLTGHDSKPVRAAADKALDAAEAHDKELEKLMDAE